jgi:hypothetical protein
MNQFCHLKAGSFLFIGFVLLLLAVGNVEMMMSIGFVLLLLAMGNVEMIMRYANGPLSRNPWAWSHPLQVALQQLLRQVREELLECGTYFMGVYNCKVRPPHLLS